MTARRNPRRPAPARLPQRRAPVLDPALFDASLRLQRPLEPAHEPMAEVLPPGSGLAISFKPSLLRRADDAIVEVPHGLTIEEIIAHLAGEQLPAEMVDVYLDGEPVPSAWWPRVRPKPAARVEVALLPAGGPEVLRMVLIAAVVVGVAFAVPVVGAALGGGIIATAGAAALGAGVPLGAALVVGGRL